MDEVIVYPSRANDEVLDHTNLTVRVPVKMPKFERILPLLFHPLNPFVAHAAIERTTNRLDKGQFAIDHHKYKTCSVARLFKHSRKGSYTL